MSDSGMPTLTVKAELEGSSYVEEESGYGVAYVDGSSSGSADSEPSAQTSSSLEDDEEVLGQGQTDQPMYGCSAYIESSICSEKVDDEDLYASTSGSLPHN